MQDWSRSQRSWRDCHSKGNMDKPNVMSGQARPNKATAFHILVDLSGVPPDLCENDKELLQCLVSAAEVGGATVINTSRYHFGHNSPPGCSAFVMLDESHLSAHTYALEGLVALDIFVCGATATEKALRMRDLLLGKIPHVGAVVDSIPRFRPDVLGSNTSSSTRMQNGEHRAH